MWRSSPKHVRQGCGYSTITYTGDVGAGGQWQKAVEIFNSMERMGLRRDAITYSSVISALAKGKQWSLAIEVRHSCVIPES